LTVPGNRWFRTALLVLATAAPAGSLLAQNTPSAVPAVAEQTNDQLAGIVESQQSTSVQKDDAAHKLLARNTPETRQLLLSLLQNAGNLDGQIAVARALAGANDLDPIYVGPLGSVLGTNDVLADAAARALVQFRNNNDAFGYLRNVADNPTLTDKVRIAVIRAMGGMNEKRTAEYLIGLLLQANQSAGVRTAAADALGDLTGLRELGEDRQRWQQWWTYNAGKNEQQWQADLLVSRSREATRLRKRYSELTDAISTLLSQQYSLLPPQQQVTAMTGYLKSPIPEIRRFGARQIGETFNFNGGKKVDNAVMDQLRSMIGDSDRDVRLEVIQTIGFMNDPDSAGPLINQLIIETDPSVRIQIARALGRADDLRAVPQLVRLLGDPLIEVGTAAARAITDLGDKIRKEDPKLSAQAAAGLRKTLEARAGNPNAADLKSAALSALAKLRDPESMPVFIQMLRQGESVSVRRSALRGLGELADPKVDDIIAASLGDEDPGVRLEALRALTDIATNAQADQLYRMLSAPYEVDPAVQNQAWQVFKKLLHTMTKEQINPWPDQFKNDPEKRLEALLAQRDIMVKDGDNLQIAYTRQRIGEAMMQLNPPRADEAADNFEQALDYWRTEGKDQPGGDSVLYGLVGQTMNALLTAKKFTEATTFASKQIAASGEFQSVVGPKIRDAADILARNGDRDAAQQLIDLARKMNPPLDNKYLEDLKQTEAQLKSPQPNQP